MKKIFLCIFLSVIFLSFVLSACVNRKNPNGPSDVIPTSTSTCTPTATPDFNFSFFVYADKTPLSAITVNLIPPLSSPTITTSTDGSGKAIFTNLHSDGDHIFVIPAHAGYADTSFTIDAPSNTSFAADFTTPTLSLANTLGNENVGLMGGTVEYTLTYNTVAEKAISFSVIGIPSTVSYTVNTTSLNNNGDTAKITFYINASQDDWQSFVFYAKAFDTINNQYISNNATLTRSWQFFSNVLIAEGQTADVVCSYNYMMRICICPRTYSAAKLGYKIQQAYATGATIGGVSATVDSYSLGGLTSGCSVSYNVTCSTPMRATSTTYNGIISNSTAKLAVGNSNYVVLRYTDGNMLNLKRKYFITWDGGVITGQGDSRYISGCGSYYSKVYYGNEITEEGQIQ